MTLVALKTGGTGTGVGAQALAGRQALGGGGDVGVGWGGGAGLPRRGLRRLQLYRWDGSQLLHHQFELTCLELSLRADDWLSLPASDEPTTTSPGNLASYVCSHFGDKTG